MVSIDKDPDVVHNITGAIIFVFYVLAALFLTSLIVSDLYLAYQSQSRLSSREGKTISNQLQVFVALAVLSFSTLSYHMLSYLILSYNEWASSRDLDQLRWLTNPSTSISLVGVDFAVRLWQFLTQSTLFHDFAETICKNGANFWWTQQALLSSIASALFISIEGEKTLSYRHHIRAVLIVFRYASTSSSSMGIPSHRPNPPNLIRSKPLLHYHAPHTRTKPFQDGAGTGHTRTMPPTSSILSLSIQRSLQRRQAFLRLSHSRPQAVAPLSLRLPLLSLRSTCINIDLCAKDSLRVRGVIQAGPVLLFGTCRATDRSRCQGQRHRSDQKGGQQQSGSQRGGL